MVAPIDTAYVYLWDKRIGAVAWDPARQASAVFSFPGLAYKTYRGLPGMLADALPDKFGNQVINAWLARQGRAPESFNPIERLCYTGKRAMGALEFAPPLNRAMEQSVSVEVAELVQLARMVTNDREKLKGDFSGNATTSILDIIRVGTSAGGARPKVVIALNDRTRQVRSGQVDAPQGFEHWILKLDGVNDASLGDPAGYGRIEYAYHKMAVAAGIRMTECRLLEENRRAHFMTRRFDRPVEGGKLHMQSLCAIAHFDYNQPGAYAYEQAFQTMRELRLPYADAEEQYRRMVFNVTARNQDDHTKNIAFVMHPDGRWRLSPAFDVIYAYNPSGEWTGTHQMTINGKRDGFTLEDLKQVGRQMNIKTHAAIINEVVAAVADWPVFAKAAGVADNQLRAIAKTHRLLW